MRNHAFIFVFLALVLAAASPAFGQAGVDISKGSVSVEVMDATGAVIPNVEVTLTGPTGSRKAATDDRGQVVFYGLNPDTYSVKVEQTGFRAYQAGNVAVNANQRTLVQARLEPGVVTETVQVSETATPVDTTTTTTGTTLSQTQIRNLPLQRNIANLFTLTPGAVSGLGTDNPNTPKQSFNPSVSGATGLENQYIIDGINTTDQGYGAFGVWSNVYGSLGSGVNFDFVREVQVKTGGFEAQYGQALGGVINVVTDSGTNDIHGSIYGYASPSWAETNYRQPNAAPRISDPRTELLGRRAYDFGVNVGGPLIKDRLFWYGAFNPSYNWVGRQAPPNFAARNYGPLKWKSSNYNWVGKISFNLTDRHRLEGTAFGDPSRDPAGVHRSLVRDDLDSESKNKYGTRNWAVKYNAVISTSTLFNATFAWNHSYFIETPTNNLFAVRDYGKPKANSAFTLAGGVGFLENNESDNRQYSVMLTRNLNALGGHQFDIGYGFNDVGYDAIRLYSGPDWPLPAARGIAPEDVGKLVHGGYFFFYPTRTVGGVTQSNAYRVYRGNFSDPVIGTTTDYHSAFVQDAWQLNRFLTAKLGVRWEQQRLQGNENTYMFAANWAPRLGFIVDPTGSRRTRIFANWGRFYEKIPQDLAVRSMSVESSYLNGHFFTLPPTQAGLVPGSVFSPTGTSPTVIYGGTKAQYQDEIVAGVEREIRGSFVVGARFIHRDLKRLLEDISGVTAEAALAGIEQQYVISNPSARLDIFHNPAECTGGPGCDLETGFTTTSGLLGGDGTPDLFPDPRRVYKALELTAEKRFGDNWSLLANYRLAKLFGNYEGLFRNDNEQSDPNITSLFDFIFSPALADQFRVGLLPSDRRHVANIYANYMFGRRLNLGMGWQIMSGTPLSRFDAHPVYLNAGEIPVGTRGTLGTAPTQNYFDTRVEYLIPTPWENVRVRLASDMFNIFNRKTVTKVDQNAQLDGGIPNEDFLKPFYVHRPFYARFALRFEF